jgi:hypothetical protein
MHEPNVSTFDHRRLCVFLARALLPVRASKKGSLDGSVATSQFSDAGTVLTWV